jgi:uncharacterized RDD family membrane protein YckC
MDARADPLESLMDEERSATPAYEKAQPGWYADPSSRHDARYWDGETWTEHVLDGGVATVDAITAWIAPTKDASRIEISGFWRRLTAWAIDAGILFVSGMILSVVFFERLVALGPRGRWIGFAIALAYFGFLNSSYGGGGTLGKRVLGIRVVDAGGRQVSLGRSLLRTLVLLPPFVIAGSTFPFASEPFGITMTLGALAFGIGAAIAYLLVFNGRTRQGVHDLAAGTFVTRVGSTGEIETSMWRPHRYGALGVVAVSAVIYVVVPFAIGGLVPGAEPVQVRVLEIGDFHSCSFVRGTNVSWSTWGGRSDTSFASVSVFLKEEPSNADIDRLFPAIADAVLAEFPGATDLDYIDVRLTLLSDVGIARWHRTTGAVYSPAEWAKILERGGFD